MNDVENGSDGRVSLAQRLAQGGIPAGEALRYASWLAEALRVAHEEGRVHGFLTPSVVWLNGPAVELAPPEGPRTLTPYTAPELLSGKPADGRADIFAFGAMVYEMLTGSRAFGGETQAELAHALQYGQPASTGNLAADKLLAGCLAKDPSRRWQQIQKVILELKLLTVTGRKAEAPRPAAAPEPWIVEAPDETGHLSDSATPPMQGFQPLLPVTSGVPAPSLQPFVGGPIESGELAAIRSEMQQSENRLAARLQLGEKAVAVLNRAVADALTALRSQISALTTQVAGLEERSGAVTVDGEAMVPAAALARIEQTLQAFGTRMEVVEKGIGVLQDRLVRAEQEAESAKQQVNLLHTSIAEDFETFEQSLRKQEKAVDSARTAMAQTDDLVERLVEALEALQATVLQRSEEWTANVN